MTPVQRLLFVGLISQADDAGNVIAEPFILWKNLFAGDGVTTEAEVKAARDELVAAGAVELYDVDSVEYVHHPKFDKHQSMNRQYRALYPLAPGQEYEPTPRTYKLSPKTHTEAAGKPKQLTLKSGPSEADLAAYALLRAAYATITAHADLPMSEKVWSQRNKVAAIDLLASGKTTEAVVKMLEVALTHPDAKVYYHGMNRLDKLAEAWPKLEAHARNPRGGGRRTFDRIGDEAAS